jgi:hypothetical protein
LPIGVSGAVLTTDGTDPIWSNAEGKNVYYVANSGSDSVIQVHNIYLLKQFITHYQSSNFRRCC